MPGTPSVANASLTPDSFMAAQGTSALTPDSFMAQQSPIDRALASVPKPKAPAMSTTALIPDSHPELHPEAAVDPITRIQQQAQDALTKHGVIRQGLLGAAAGTGAAETLNSPKDTITGAAKMFALGPNEDETDPVSKTLSYVPVVGPIYRMINGTVQNVNQAGGDLGEGLAKGDYEQAAHGGGQLLTSMIGGALGAREAPGALGEEGGTTVARAGIDRGVGTIKAAAKASGIGLTPTEKLVKAGGPSVRDANFPQALEIAAPELKRQDAVTPIKSVQDLTDAAHTAANNLWRQSIEPQITRNATETINGSEVAKQIRSGIDEGMQDLFPDQAKTAKDFAGKFDQELPLPKANAYLKTLNAQLKGFYKMTPEGRAAAGVTDGRISAMENAADGLRQQIYEKLDSLGETDPAGLRKQYGALKQVQDVFRKRAIVSGRQGPLNLPQLLAIGGGGLESVTALLSGHPLAATAGIAPVALTAGLKLFNSPDMLVRRGITGLPDAPQQPFTLTPPAGRLPGPLQQILNLSGGENVPGQDLKLTPPEGQMPPDAQRPLPLTEPPAAEPRQVFPGQINGPSGPTTPPETENAPKGNGTPPGGNGAAFSVEQIKNMAADREATDIARAERDAGKLPKGVSYVQRAQQLKEQLQAGSLASILEAAKAYNLK